MRQVLVKSAAFILIIILLGAVQPLSAQDSLSTPSFGRSFIPALQSTVVPGWGQFSQGEWLRGGVYLLGEAFLAADAYYYWEKQYGRPGYDDAGRLFSREVAYGLAAWYGAGAVFCAADAYYFSSKKRTTCPTLAALQSALFPGWGQLANGQHWKAAGMFVLQTGLAFSVYYQHENYLFQHRQGHDDEARFYKNDRNRLIWWSVGALIFSAADAFVDCHLRDWNVSDDLSLTPVFFPEQKTVGIGFRIPIKMPQITILK